MFAMLTHPLLLLRASQASEHGVKKGGAPAAEVEA